MRQRAADRAAFWAVLVIGAYFLGEVLYALVQGRFTEAFK